MSEPVIGLASDPVTAAILKALGLEGLPVKDLSIHFRTGEIATVDVKMTHRGSFPPLWTKRFQLVVLDDEEEQTPPKFLAMHTKFAFTKEMLDNETVAARERAEALDQKMVEEHAREKAEAIEKMVLEGIAEGANPVVLQKDDWIGLDQATLEEFASNVVKGAAERETRKKLEMMNSQITDLRKREVVKEKLLELWDLMDLSSPPTIRISDFDLEGWQARYDAYAKLGEVLLGDEWPEKEVLT